MEYEQAQDLNSSPMWASVTREIDSWIEMEKRKLCNCSLEQLSSIQVTIRAYERMKALPNIIKEREE